MKKSHFIFLISTFVIFGSLFFGGFYLSNKFGKTSLNPYESQGLHVKWHVGGATNSYPWIEVWAIHESEMVKPDIHFGGLEEPELEYRDFDGDGTLDIVFIDGDVIQAVAFFPAEDGEPPKFVTLRNDVTW